MADKRIGELPLIEDLDDESFFVAEQQGAAGHITGAQIKGFARKSVEDIANASQKSAEAAAKSASAAQESATQAEEAQEAAESAKSGAEVAQKAAETAQGAAADAQAGAESAKTAAEAAADVAAKDAAEGVREELSVYVEQTEANAQAAAWTFGLPEAAASPERGRSTRAPRGRQAVQPRRRRTRWMRRMPGRLPKRHRAKRRPPGGCGSGQERGGDSGGHGHYKGRRSKRERRDRQAVQRKTAEAAEWNLVGMERRDPGVYRYRD